MDKNFQQLQHPLTCGATEARRSASDQTNGYCVLSSCLENWEVAVSLEPSSENALLGAMIGWHDAAPKLLVHTAQMSNSP